MNDLISPEGNLVGRDMGLTNAAEKLSNKPNKPENKNRSGSELSSTPISKEDMENLIKGDEQLQKETAKIFLQQEMKADGSVNNQPMIEKAVIKDLNQPPLQKITSIKNENSNGFFMSFVNSFNGLLDGIWKILTSWIPMKQTGTGTA